MWVAVGGWWYERIAIAVRLRLKDSMKFIKELVMVEKGTEVIPDIVNYVFIVVISL